MGLPSPPVPVLEVWSTLASACCHLHVTGEDTVVKKAQDPLLLHVFGSVLSPLRTPRMHTWGTRTPEKLHSLPSLPSSGRSDYTPPYILGDVCLHPDQWGDRSGGRASLLARGLPLATLPVHVMAPGATCGPPEPTA